MSGPSVGYKPASPHLPARKGLYILPSIFTAANIAAGYYAISQSIAGSVSDPWHFDLAAKAIGFAILFDGLDGRIARITNTASAFGRELDSLADVIAFGIAPALLAWLWGFRTLPAMNDFELRGQIVKFGAVATFVFLMAGAARLARFNIQVNPQPSNPGRPGRKYFVGMPIPAGAGVIASVVHFESGSPISDPRMAIVWLCLILFTGFLMVSTWRFWSGKEISLGQRHPFQLVAVIVAVGALIALYSEYVLIIVALGYLVSGVVARLAYSWGQKRRRVSAANQ